MTITNTELRVALAALFMKHAAEFSLSTDRTLTFAKTVSTIPDDDLHDVTCAWLTVNRSPVAGALLWDDLTALLDKHAPAVYVAATALQELLEQFNTEGEYALYLDFKGAAEKLISQGWVLPE